MEITEFINKVLAEQNNKSEYLSLGKLSENEILMLKEKTGFDLQDFERIIDKFGVIHAFVKHGNENIESKHGQVAIKVEDFNKIQDITNEPDKIEAGEKNSHGKNLIKYYKKLDSTYIYVEEKRDGKKVLATQTFYKRKNP